MNTSKFARKKQTSAIANLVRTRNPKLNKDFVVHGYIYDEIVTKMQSIFREIRAKL